MARKNESFFDLLAACPWWVSVIMSLCVYIFMRYVFPSILIRQHDPLGGPIFKGIAHGVYMLAPFAAIALLIPIPFSLFYAWERKRRPKM